MTLTLRDLEAWVHTAHDRGARAAELLTRHGATTRVERRDRRNIPVHTTQDASLTVRCWLDEGRTGEASGDPEDPGALLDRALAAAASAPPDPWAGPVERLGSPPRGLGIDDRRHEQLTLADRQEVVISNEGAAAKVDARVRTGLFTYSDRRERRALANSKGVSMEAWSTTYEATGHVSIRVPEGTIALDDQVAGRAFTATACLPFGANLARRAADLLTDGPPTEGPIRVLLRPKAVASVIDWLAEALIAPTRPALFGDGGQLFHRRLHLVDDGALPGGLRTYGFDDRGVPPVPLTLLREGVVDALPVSPEDGRRQRTRPTGHVRGGHARPTNLQLHAGMRSINAHLGEQTSRVFDVAELVGLDRALDAATGDLDLEVHGVLWDRQTPLGALRFMRLRGNLREALSSIAGVASDTDRILHVDAPAIFVDGLALARP